jgi:hypothetical protein
MSHLLFISRVCVVICVADLMWTCVDDLACVPRGASIVTPPGGLLHEVVQAQGMWCLGRVASHEFQWHVMTMRVR